MAFRYMICFCKSKLDEPFVRFLFRQLIEAVAAIHGNGLVHCDIKPSNILLTGAGRLVLLDFGLAKCVLEAKKTASSQPIWSGTPGYMAPEQFTLCGNTEATDLYSVGATMCECLTSGSAFPDTGVDASLVKLFDKGRRRSGNVQGLEAIARSLLHQDPGARPSIEQLRRSF